MVKCDTGKEYKKMKNELVIKYSGLPNGKHDWKISLEKSFFKQFEESGIEDGQLTLDIQMAKENNIMNLEIIGRGKVNVSCDRCLDNFDLDVDFIENLVVKVDLAEENSGQEDEIMYVSPAEAELDLNKFVHDSILLGLPIQKVHPEDEKGNSLCNKEMLDKLAGTKNKDDNDIDPRWNGLLNLINNN